MSNKIERTHQLFSKVEQSLVSGFYQLAPDARNTNNAPKKMNNKTVKLAGLRTIIFERLIALLTPVVTFDITKFTNASFKLQSLGTKPIFTLTLEQVRFNENDERVVEASQEIQINAENAYSEAFLTLYTEVYESIYNYYYNVAMRSTTAGLEVGRFAKECLFYDELVLVYGLSKALNQQVDNWCQKLLAIGKHATITLQLFAFSPNMVLPDDVQLGYQDTVDYSEEITFTVKRAEQETTITERRIGVTNILGVIEKVSYVYNCAQKRIRENVDNATTFNPFEPESKA